MNAAADPLTAELRRALGADVVSTDVSRLTVFGQDIFAAGAFAPAAIVTPRSAAETARAVGLASGAGRAVIARGAGMSYTGGYLADEPGAIVIDMTAMDRVLSINAEDMTVTVEAGCRWSDLHEALRKRGLRTPFWGPLSGLVSTVGGGLSQNNALLGAAAYGPASESVIGVEVALADGRLLQSAASAGRSEPFVRAFGPDLTGLFLGDCGAFGVKTAATLRLIPDPEHTGFASFAFATRESAVTATSAFARRGVGADVFGFDPRLQKVRMKRESLAADVRALASVARSGKSPLSGVRDAVRIAAAGRGFVGAGEYTVHIACEGRSSAAVAADLAAARSLARDVGGREIENTIPKVLRAQPFQPLNAVLGPDGERWVPVHGILPHSAAQPAWAQLDAAFAEVADRLDAAGISHGYLFTTLSTNAFLLEPVLYWPDAIGVLHEETVSKDILARLPLRPRNPDARRLVEDMRIRIIEILDAHGAAHFQIGRLYPYGERLSAPGRAALEAIKSVLDPQRRLNPGALGLR